MKKITLIVLLVCACMDLQAQTNFVKNPGLEEYKLCPNDINRINWTKHWSMPGDSTTTREHCPEYYNACGNDSFDIVAHIPDNGYFYGYPHSGNGMAGSVLYYDKTSPPPPGYLPFNYRDNLVGRLYDNLTAGKIYCVSFWVVMAETSGVGHNKIGAYLDDGAINGLPDTLGNEITSVKPQVFTNEVIMDTLNWNKIEGSFTANGTETFITLGNFFPNDSVTTIVANYRFFGTQYSYYLIDDVSVFPLDLKADAGKDSHAEPGNPVQIGRVGDTTAQGLDCKWYHKGALIDSGAIINVKGSAIVGTVDTYVVVQTICGLVKTDTVTVKTVPLGMKEWNTDNTFSVFPNPSDGQITITTKSATSKVNTILYDLLGRVQFKQIVSSNSTLKLEVPIGVYILELSDDNGTKQRERLLIR